MKRLGFVLANDFTHSAFALFVDALRLAGDEGDRSRRVAYDWQVLGDAGLPIRSSCGVEVLPTASILNRQGFDSVVVVGGLLHRRRQLSTGGGGAGGTYRYYTCSTKARQGKTAAWVGRSPWTGPIQSIKCRD